MADARRGQGHDRQRLLGLTADLSARYRAFLSYSHADEALAERLHKALEAYVLPARIRKSHGLPRRLIPIFRDAEELSAASSLTARLQDALTDSRFLVVLCSPAAARSKYVNQEIEFFLRTHGAERLLCALLEGEPAQAFPEAIKALPHEPLAADLRPGADFNEGKLQLIAALAGVGYGELRDREGARRRRQRMAAAALVGGVVAGGLGYWDLLKREHVDFYANYVRENGIWQGVDPLDATAVQHRAASYRFVRHGRLNPPERVDYYKGCGTFEKHGMRDILQREDLTEDFVSHQTCAAVFRYHGDGSVASETLVNGRGTPRITLTYTEPDLAQLTEGGYAAETTGSGIAYVHFTRDERGRDAKIEYLRAKGQPRANPLHAYGYLYAYDEAGHAVRESALDDHGAETGEVTLHEYGALGVETRMSCVDSAGAPSLCRQGYARVDREADAVGNVTREAFFDVDGSPTTDLDGVYALRRRYDERGNLIEKAALDSQGRPMAWANGIALQRNEFDARGYRTRTAFFGLDGNPVEDRDGAASYTLLNDEHGDNLENRLFDARGEPVRNGNSIDRKKFDAQGNQLEECFFSADGKPVMLVYGACIRHEYDERGNMLTFEFFDAEGRRYTRPGLGCALRRNRFDARSNFVEAACLDEQLKPIRGYTGWAYLGLGYDEAGNQVEWRNFGVDHEPVNNRWGYSVRRAKFDRTGNEIEVRWFDAAGKPALNTLEQNWGWSAEYDSRGRRIRKTTLDASGRAAMTPAGWARSDFELDPSGGVVRERYFDATGAPISGARPAELRYTYDSHHREVSRQYFDSAGRPAAGADHYSSLLTEFDAAGHLVAERCEDAAGKPVARRTGGWAMHRIDYAAGRRVEHWFDAAGREIPAPK